MNKTMLGTVTGHDGRYYTVECPTAPAHLQLLHLTGWQVGGAKVGDTVRLEYQTTPSSGLWNVVDVLNDECEHDWQEQPGEPPVDVCNSCGAVRE